MEEFYVDVMFSYEVQFTKNTKKTCTFPRFQFNSIQTKSVQKALHRNVELIQKAFTLSLCTKLNTALYYRLSPPP